MLHFTPDAGRDPAPRVSDPASATPFSDLVPDTVLAAIDEAGFVTDGRMLALNSFENRVFQIGIEESTPLVAKFYRPGRWSDAQILEEHRYSQELADAELPAVAPLTSPDGQTLMHARGHRFALYPRRAGRAPDADNPEVLERIGRLIGRMHGIGRRDRFRHRLPLDVAHYGEPALKATLDSPLLAEGCKSRYREAATLILASVDRALRQVAPFTGLRLHGDCHWSNVLWREEQPLLVDFDDARSGPAIQDLWMLLPEDPIERQPLQLALLDGYGLFADFNYAELALIEPLRGLRMVQYDGWLAARWADPAFPLAFPWAGQLRHWEQQCLLLDEQLRRIRGVDDFSD